MWRGRLRIGDGRVLTRVKSLEKPSRNDPWNEEHRLDKNRARTLHETKQAPYVQISRLSYTDTEFEQRNYIPRRGFSIVECYDAVPFLLVLKDGRRGSIYTVKWVVVQ